MPSAFFWWSNSALQSVGVKGLKHSKRLDFNYKAKKTVSQQANVKLNNV